MFLGLASSLTSLLARSLARSQTSNSLERRPFSFDICVVDVIIFEWKMANELASENQEGQILK